MKNLFRYTFAILLAGMTFTACSPEQFDGADVNGIPTVSGTDFSMTVDQETNQMIATYTPAPGTYPIWLLNGTQYSTLQEIGYQNPEAGTYNIELRLGNRNGFSQASVQKTFTFNETKIDYSADFRRLCEKEWRIASKEVAHLACGEAGTDGTNWWSAQPDDKKDFGIYDDRITFTANTRKGGSYNYNAGEDGLTFVNTGTTKWGSESADFDAKIGNQTAAWSFEVYDWQDKDGNVSKQTYIQLAANTAFPYISSDAQYENPKFRIESLTAKKMVLVYDAPDRAIAWRFILINGEDEPEKPDEPGAIFDWNIDSPSNLWKAVEDGSAFVSVTPWFANEGWSQIADPVWSHDADVWSLTIPEGIGSSQWQGQFPINTTLTATAGKKYDIFCIVEADNDIPGVTIKFTDTADDQNFFTADRHDVVADKQFVFKAEGVTLSKEADSPALSFFFDFGGAPAGTNVKISKIYFAEAVSLSYDDAENLWKSVDDGSAFVSVTPWFADGGWSQIADPVWNHDGKKWTLTIPEGMGGDQWQGQFPINTTLTAGGTESYNFSCTILADNDCPGVTIKLTDTVDDQNFFTADRHQVTADQPYVFTLKGASLAKAVDSPALSLFFDFGGTPAGTNITISDIIFEKVK